MTPPRLRAELAMASDAARPAPDEASIDARALEVRRTSASAQPSSRAQCWAALLQAAVCTTRPATRVGALASLLRFCCGTASLLLNHAAKRPVSATAPRTYA